MAGGVYTALSGLRTRMEQLDRLASDIANSKTAGYKAERVTTHAAERPDFGRMLQSAIDVAPGVGHVDFRPGALERTGRDLDVAIDGKGFFVIDTPQGPRYTRNGSFTRQPDGLLTTGDGHAVQGTAGPLRITGDGPLSMDEDGTLRAGAQTVGRLRVVDFADYTRLQREDVGRFRASASDTPLPAADGTVLRTGLLEASNVSVVDRMVALTDVARGFEALQRGLSLLMNDLDMRVAQELGRRGF
jgi:flagellar basal-body rod protein FlgF